MTYDSLGSLAKVLLSEAESLIHLHTDYDLNLYITTYRQYLGPWGRKTVAIHSIRGVGVLSPAMHPRRFNGHHWHTVGEHLRAHGPR